MTAPWWESRTVWTGKVENYQYLNTTWCRKWNYKFKVKIRLLAYQFYHWRHVKIWDQKIKSFGAVIGTTLGKKSTQRNWKSVHEIIRREYKRMWRAKQRYFSFNVCSIPQADSWIAMKWANSVVGVPTLYLAKISEKRLEIKQTLVLSISLKLFYVYHGAT